MFFVAGMTGRVGGAAARKLLDEGHAVRALARDPQKAAEWARKGVDVRRGDFNDAAGVAGALDGVEGVFLMLPPFFASAPGFPKAKIIIASFVEALREAPPPRLVVLSSIGSQQRERPRAHHRHPPARGGPERPGRSDRLRPGRLVPGELPSWLRGGGLHRVVRHPLDADGPRRADGRDRGTSAGRSPGSWSAAGRARESWRSARGSAQTTSPAR